MQNISEKAQSGKPKWHREELACGTIRYRLFTLSKVGLLATPYFIDKAKVRAHYSYGEPVGLWGAGMGKDSGHGYRTAGSLGGFAKVTDAKAAALKLLAASVSESFSAECDMCGRAFADDSPELAADMLEAHKAIAHKPEPLPLPDSSANVVAFRPRAEFRAPTPDDEPEPSPTGTDSPASTAEAEPDTKNPSEGQQTHAGGALTVTREMLRALKLINDANVLAERRASEGGKADGRDDCARVRLGDVETIINVARLDKWAATFEPGRAFTVEFSESGMTLTSGTSFIRFEGRQGIPASLEVIELARAESGEIAAPALPSPEEMKQARKALSEGRKALKAEKAARKAKGEAVEAANAAKDAAGRVEKLEAEARALIARAEELTADDCEEAVIIARALRDLRRLRREVERAAEDPQMRTCEQFAWMEDEHRRLYAEAFAGLEKARRRGWHRKAETAEKACAGVLRSAFGAHARPALRELTGEDEPSAFRLLGRVWGHRYGRGSELDTEAQSVKRALRRLWRELPRARADAEVKRADAFERLTAISPLVTETETENYRRMLATYSPEPRALAA